MWAEDTLTQRWQRHELLPAGPVWAAIYTYFFGSLNIPSPPYTARAGACWLAVRYVLIARRMGRAAPRLTDFGL